MINIDPSVEAFDHVSIEMWEGLLNDIIALTDTTNEWFFLKLKENMQIDYINYSKLPAKEAFNNLVLGYAKAGNYDSLIYICKAFFGDNAQLFYEGIDAVSLGNTPAEFDLIVKTNNPSDFTPSFTLYMNDGTTDYAVYMNDGTADYAVYLTGDQFKGIFLPFLAVGRHLRKFTIEPL